MIIDVDDQHLPLDLAQCRRNGRREFPVSKQRLRLTVIEHESNGLRVEPRIQGVQHGTGHWHAEVRLEHRGHIRRHYCYGVAGADAAPHQG